MFDLLDEFIKDPSVSNTMLKSLLEDWVYSLWKHPFQSKKKVQREVRIQQQKNDYEVEDSLTMKEKNIYSIIERERNYIYMYNRCIISVRLSSKRKYFLKRENTQLKKLRILTMKEKNIYSIIERERNYIYMYNRCIISVRLSSKRKYFLKRENTQLKKLRISKFIATLIKNKILRKGDTICLRKSLDFTLWLNNWFENVPKCTFLFC